MKGTRFGADRTRRGGSRRLLRVFALLLLAVLLLTACNEQLPQNSLDPAGPEAEKIDDLWWIAFWIAVAIFVAVWAVLLFAVFRFRRRGGEDRPVKQVHGNMRLEVIWTMIPAVILAVIAVPTVRTIFDLRSAPDPSENALEINVIGHQWWWEFQYPEYDITTANEMYIPTDRAVYLRIVSADVIHSFWVPRLNGKRDAVPGRINYLTIEADEPGVYLGQCAEFCGLAHADMRHRVFAVTAAEFEEWAERMAAPADIPSGGLAADGWQTFQQVCVACHVVDGGDNPVTQTIDVGEDEGWVVALAPDLTHYSDRTTFGGASFENTEDHLRSWLDDPSELKPMDPDRNDIPAGKILGMPDFGLDADQIEALIALLRSFE